MLGSTGAKSRFSILILTLILLPSLASAVKVRVSWNPNTEADLAGYWVYYGTSPASYNHLIGIDTTPSVEVSGLQAGQTYYFCVTARDTSGNQSGFSREVSVTVPASAASGEDTGGSAATSASVVSAGAISLNTNGSFAAAAGSIQHIEEQYPVRDAVLKAMNPFDLVAVYPSGMFFFYPLDDGCPVIAGDAVTADAPGCYRYMVFDELGDADHVLRLSVAEELYGLQTYNPSLALFLEDEVSGISVEIPVSAVVEEKPIAIGWGGEGVYPGSAQLGQAGQAVYFDILPYHLVLDEPATVSLPYDGTSPSVQWYDDENRAWVVLGDVRASGGYVTFSTQALGSFKVVDQPQQASGGETTSSSRGSNGGGMCYIDTARGQAGSGVVSWQTLSFLVLVFLGFTLRSRSSRAWHAPGVLRDRE